MIPAKILHKKVEATGILSFELMRSDGAALPPFSAGSHIDVHLPGGLIRQYSLCNDPAEQLHYRIAVLRDPASRGGSVAMHDALEEGDIITISEPRNHFRLVRAKKTLLFAGGIGITPLLCMARRLNTMDADFALHYCTRSADRTAFREEITASEFAANVQFHHDDGVAHQKLDLPALIAQPEPGTHVYVCGPTGFIDWVVQTASQQGWPGDQVHVEYFGASPHDTTGNKPFQVKLASSGALYDIPADKSVAQALQEHGVGIPVSCEQGVCGTCVTGVLEGECDHRDLYFTDQEKSLHDQFTPCCSRARGNLLVLDL